MKTSISYVSSDRYPESVEKLKLTPETIGEKALLKDIHEAFKKATWGGPPLWEVLKEECLKSEQKGN